MILHLQRNLEEIGKFNTHANELNPDKFYVYRVEGGCDWDVDDDGIKDQTCTQNKGVIRAIAKGIKIQEVGENFKITAVSEIVYEKVAKYLKYNYSSTNLESKLKESIIPVIQDIDGDGKVDIKDIITFNPKINKYKLKGIYKEKYSFIVQVIHEGRYVFTSIGSIDALYYAYDVEISSDGSKAYVADAGLKIIDMRLFEQFLNKVLRINILLTKDKRFRLKKKEYV